MEQYEIPPGRYYEMLSWSLENAKAEHVFIRLVGSCGGTVKVNENVEGKSLVIKHCRNGLRILIAGKEVFFFETTSYRKNTRLSGKSWAIAFFRIHNDGRIRVAGTGYADPDDRNLPEVKQTIFRSVNHDHLIEITFLGKVPIRRLSRLVSAVPGWYYWEIDRARAEAVRKT